MRIVVAGAWLLFACWLVGAARPTPARAEDAARKPSEPHWEPTIKGYGLTVDKAKADAVRAALAKLEACLLEHDPPLTAWKPDEAFVRSHLIHGDGQEDKKLDDKGKTAESIKAKGADLGPVTTWVYALLPPNWSLLRYLDHKAVLEQRSRERQGVAVLVVAMAFVGCVVLWVVMQVGRREKVSRDTLPYV